MPFSTSFLIFILWILPFSIHSNSQQFTENGHNCPKHQKSKPLKKMNFGLVDYGNLAIHLRKILVKKSENMSFIEDISPNVIKFLYSFCLKTK